MKAQKTTGKAPKQAKNEYSFLLRLESAIAKRVKARADEAKRSLNQQINFELDQP